MAIIYTYPIKTTPVDADKVLISDSQDSNKTKQVTIHFEENNGRPIIVDGTRGMGILMPCKHETTVQHTQNKLVDHKIAVRQAMTAYEATRVSNTLS